MGNEIVGSVSARAENRRPLVGGALSLRFVSGASSSRPSACARSSGSARSSRIARSSTTSRSPASGSTVARSSVWLTRRATGVRSDERRACAGHAERPKLLASNPTPPHSRQTRSACSYSSRRASASAAKSAATIVPSGIDSPSSGIQTDDRAPGGRIRTTCPA